jgi:phage terminase Nu1 subunit (DNA packaging protein)
MPTNSGERVFTSWKEIASFFGKGVRTVQRWEQKFGLPISRPTAAKNVVIATESELRDWIRRSSAQISDDHTCDVIEDNNHRNDSNLAEIALRLKRLEEHTARLSRVVAAFSERIEELSSKRPLITPRLNVKGSARKPTTPTHEQAFTDS